MLVNIIIVEFGIWRMRAGIVLDIRCSDIVKRCVSYHFFHA